MLLEFAISRCRQLLIVVEVVQKSSCVLGRTFSRAVYSFRAWTLCCSMAQRVFFLTSEHCCLASTLAEETSNASGPFLPGARILGVCCSFYARFSSSLPRAQPTHYNSGTFRDARGLNTVGPNTCSLL